MSDTQVSNTNETQAETEKYKQTEANLSLDNYYLPSEIFF